MKGKFWPLRDLPAALWLALVALVLILRPTWAAPRWLVLHLFFLGALTHSILVWSQHFAAALLHRPTDRRQQTIRLLAANLGTVAIVTGVLAGHWPLIIAGAASVAYAAISHGVSLFTSMRTALSNRFAPAVSYYVVAAGFFVIGVTVGTILTRSLSEALRANLKLSHAIINVLGWVGLTILGTLITFWPTMLRTRMLDGTVTLARRTVWWAASGAAVAAAGAGLGSKALVAVGLVLFLVSLGMIGTMMWQLARVKPPVAFATWSVAAGYVWFLGCVLALVIAAARSTLTGVDLHLVTALDTIAPYLAAGMGAQILLGALSHLLPVAVSTGPASVKVGVVAMDVGLAFRVTAANGLLLLTLFPIPPLVTTLAWIGFIVLLGAFAPIAGRSARLARQAAGGRTEGLIQVKDGPTVAEVKQTTSVRPQLAAAVATVLAVVVAGVAADPAAAGFGAGSSDPAVATGEHVVVQVTAHGMSFTPNRIEVPAGAHLTIELTNADATQVHDLVLATGPASPRLFPGGTATIDAGVITRDIEGWCSIVGHRQMGMTLDIIVIDTEDAIAPTSPTNPADADASHDPHATSTPSDPGSHHHHHGPTTGTSAVIDFAASPSSDFTAYDASLAPLPPGTDPVVHTLTLEVQEVELEVAPGVTQRLWTYNGTVPGPTLHGKVGDVFDITLINSGTMGHSIDFHASNLAPDRPMRTIPPGEQLTYRFTAFKAGIWMYHCSTMPMSAHIANGMAGAVVIEPPDLPPVDRTYVLSQHDYFLGPPGGEVDLDKLAAQTPDAVVFNGYVNQYTARPLPAIVGERVRIWVLALGPSRPTSFHVVGGQFDTVWFEGDYLLNGGPGGSQALALAPAQGGFVELVFPEAGNYSFVSHYMVDAEHGAHGVFAVEPRPDEG